MTALPDLHSRATAARWAIMVGMDEEWITTAEACQISGYNLEYLRRLLRDGAVQGRKWGREWMVDRGSLMAYVWRGPRPGPPRGVRRTDSGT